jgi:hypothetical protein
MNRFLSALIVLTTSSVLAMSATAAATSTTDSGSGNSTETTKPSGTFTPRLISRPVPDDPTASKDLTNQYKQLAQEKINAKKQQIKEHTQAERQKLCQGREKALNRRMGLAVSVAKAHKSFFDKVYTNLKKYHDNKQLNVTNYDSLVAAADQAQANAQASIDALAALDVNVDCASQTVASDVAAYQQAVANTRDSLKDYRSALVDLVKALKLAAGNSTDNTNRTGQ